MGAIVFVQRGEPPLSKKRSVPERLPTLGGWYHRVGHFPGDI